MTYTVAVVFFFAFAVVEYKVRGLHLLQISCCQKRAKKSGIVDIACARS